MNNVSAFAIGAIIVLAILSFFLLPVVPYSSSNAGQSLVGAKATAQVSPSYLVFNCGLVYNPAIGGTYGSASIASRPWQGGRWECGNSWAR
jgi:hypothetical protein